MRYYHTLLYTCALLCGLLAAKSMRKESDVFVHRINQTLENIGEIIVSEKTTLC